MKGYVQLDRELIDILATDKNALAIYCVLLANTTSSREPTVISGQITEQRQCVCSYRRIAKQAGNRCGRGIKPLSLSAVGRALDNLEANKILIRKEIECGTLITLLTPLEVDQNDSTVKESGTNVGLPRDTHGKVQSKKTTRKVFQKPTIEQVRQYCSERKNSLDAGGFWDYYEARGWKLGSRSMQDWKACVRTWEKNRLRGNGQKSYDDRKQTLVDLCRQYEKEELENGDKTRDYEAAIPDLLSFLEN